MAMQTDPLKLTYGGSTTSTNAVTPYKPSSTFGSAINASQGVVSNYNTYKGRQQAQSYVGPSAIGNMNQAPAGAVSGTRSALTPYKSPSIATTPNTFENSPYADRYKGAQAFAQRDANAALAQAERAGREASAQGGYGVGSAIGQAIVQKNLAGAREYGLGLKENVMNLKDSAYADWVKRQENLEDVNTARMDDWLSNLDNEAAYTKYMEYKAQGLDNDQIFTLLNQQMGEGGELAPKDDYEVAYESAMSFLSHPENLAQYQARPQFSGMTAEQIAASLAGSTAGATFESVGGLSSEEQLTTQARSALSGGQGATFEALRNNPYLASKLTPDDLALSNLKDLGKTSDKAFVADNPGARFQDRDGQTRISLGYYIDSAGNVNAASVVVGTGEIITTRFKGEDGTSTKTTVPSSGAGYYSREEAPGF